MADRPYYEAYDQRYRAIHGTGEPWFSDTPTPVLGEVLARYGVGRDTPMLELGCGEGRDAGPLLSAGYDLLATDVSPAAVRVAKKNVQDLHLGGRVTCLQIDVRRPATPFLGKFDLLVSNPPYVTDAEMEKLPPEVADYEPALALRGGPDCLDLYRAILDNYTGALNPGGFICFEFGMGQQDAVCDLLRGHGYEVVTTREDYRKVIRAVLARKK